MVRSLGVCARCSVTAHLFNWRLANRPETGLKGGRLKFEYRRKRKATALDVGEPKLGNYDVEVRGAEWEGYYEGHFMLKNHGHEQCIFETFAVWRSEKMSTFTCENGGPFFDVDVNSPPAVEAVVFGTGQNIYGKFFLRGAVFLDGYLRLERLYAVRGDTKRVRPTGTPRERRLLVPFVARSSTREKRPPVLFDNSAPSPDHSSDCNDSDRHPHKTLSESPKHGHACGSIPGVRSCREGTLSDKEDSDTSMRRGGNLQQSDAGVPEDFGVLLDSSDELSSEDGDEIIKNWQSVLVDEDSDEIYEGDVCPVTGLRHGLGAIVYLAHGHRIYEGKWRHGREHGRGVILSRDRTVLYNGEFADGKIHGRGVYYLPSGAVYSGEFRENTKHGFGRYVVPAKCNGYVGEWRDNARHGRGRFEDSDSSSYDGEWAFDRQQGKATLDLADGTTYDGHWTEGNFEGRGSCIRLNGIKYVGMWRHGRKEGRGSLTWPNGASYEGRFRDDKIDGQGALLVPVPVLLVEDERDYNDSPTVTYSDNGWLLPIELKADMARVHMKAGFDEDGL